MLQKAHSSEVETGQRKGPGVTRELVAGLPVGGPGSSRPLRWDGNRLLQPQLRQDRSLQPGVWGGAARGGSREQQTCGISEVLPETLPAPSGIHRSRTR